MNPLILAAGGALGAAGLLARRYRPPRAVLYAYAPHHLEANWTDYTDSFWAVSVRLVRGPGKAQPTDIMLATLDQGQAAGLRRWGHGYHYCRDDWEAEAEGRLAAAQADLADLDVYGWNAEREWGGSKNFPGADDPVRTSAIFAETFLSSVSRPRELAWVSYTTESARWHGSPHAVLDTPENVRYFKFWSPMLFSTDPALIERRWLEKVGKWRHLGLVDSPLMGSGRMEYGKAWGYAFNQGHTPGLISLTRQSHPPGISWYYGNFSLGMLSTGNAINPPIPEVLRDLKAQYNLLGPAV